ncbi:ROK family protein [Devosia sp. 2618]|uniref:ROK family protein n=1 Tax=Devosia sp. 2618 TaxID=3156454 RepID=UPI0033949C91
MGTTAIGVDIGGTHVRAARVSDKGSILASARAPSSSDPAAVLATTVALIGQVMDSGVTGIGVGVPGRVDSTSAAVLSGGYVDLSKLPFAQLLREATGLDVVLENDCSMALLGEAAFGAGRGKQNIVMLTIGTGIGGAALEHGHLMRGRSAAGQLGHLVVEPNGRLCACGRHGCVETLSSGTAFGRHVIEAGLPVGTSADSLLAARDAGDEVASAVLLAWAGPLRRAVDSLVATLDPDLVILGGGMGKQAVAALSAIAPEACWYDSPVVAAELGDDAGVIGAAQCAMDRLSGPKGKRAILVNGVPASGKSRVAHALSERTGWPLLTLDTIKNPFLEVIEGVDRPFNRTLGKASYKAIWSLVADAPAGTTVIVDAWFGFQPREVLDDYLAMAGVTETLELWCHAPPNTIVDRYAARLGDRLPGHPGAAYLPELGDLAARATPLDRGPTRRIDTTEPTDFGTVSAWIAENWVG